METEDKFEAGTSGTEESDERSLSPDEDVEEPSPDGGETKDDEESLFTSDSGMEQESSLEDLSESERNRIAGVYVVAIAACYTK